MKKTVLYIILSLLIFSVFAGNAKAEEPAVVKNVIADFSARLKKDNINFYWKILNPENVNQITIDYRKAGSESYQRLEMVTFNSFDKRDLSDSINTYNYSVRSKLKENGVYFFRVTLLDNNNNEVTFDEMKIGVSGIPEFKLHQNNPNPFNPSTIISYELLIAGKVSLVVYNMTGKTVAVLVDEFQNPGVFNFEFNAGSYGDLSSGIYFYKLQTSYSSDIKKMILTK